MKLILIAGLMMAWLGVVNVRADDAPGAPSHLWVYVGTYTNAKSKGIYRLELDLQTGKLSDAQLAAETASPNFLAIHPTGQNLYAVGQVRDSEGKTSGAVCAFALDRKSGALKMLNCQSSVGAGPCHLVVDRAGKNVLVANYGGGSAAVLPIQPDGQLAKASSFVQHKGSSVNKSRQEAPHAHSINLDKDNRFAFVADLGLDKVLIYRFDAAQGMITPNEPDAATVAPGAGPRHFAFHPSGKYAYVINEMDLTITAFDYDAGQGTLKTRQTISTVPPGTEGKNLSTAEVVVHPSGRFLYGSNRGHHTIAIFNIDSATGELRAAGHQGKTIKTPRNFAIEPTGRFLLVANQDGNSISVFAIDQKTGALELAGEPVAVPMPVCIRFLAR